MTNDFTRREFGKTVGALGGAWLAGASRSSSANVNPEHGLLPGSEDYFQQALVDWRVPGMAIAVVKDGKVVLARGYGVRQLGSETAVDENTLFPIASCTKSFTAAIIARLVDQGELHWDDAISRYLPEFRLPNGMGRNVTIRHALQHRTGYPTANMLWRSGAFNADEILRRIPLIEPVAAPGDKFIYNNSMYLAVGRVAERVSGSSWAELLANMFLQPLGMDATTPDSSRLDSLTNVAIPHRVTDGRVTTIERYCPDVVAPAGAMHSTVTDMAKWLFLHLNQGTFAGKTLLSPARITDLHSPVETAPPRQAEDNAPKAPMSRYGLGWFVNEYSGETIVEHSGTQNGFVAWMAMIPCQRIGLVVLSNQHQTGLNYALRNWVFDRLLDRPKLDWSDSVLRDYTQGWQRLLHEAKTRYDDQRPEDATPGRSERDYLGTYVSPIYGKISVTVDEQRLTLDFGTRFQGEMQPWGPDTFRVFFPTPGLDDWLVTFSAQSDRIHSLHVQESPWAPEWYDDRDDLGVFALQEAQARCSQMHP